MDMRNICKLSEKQYMVSWKADGTRYLMLIEGEGRVYFIDRDNCVFVAHNITFPCKKNLNDHLYETLVDGVRFRTFEKTTIIFHRHQIRFIKVWNLFFNRRWC